MKEENVMPEVRFGEIFSSSINYARRYKDPADCPKCQGRLVDHIFPGGGPSCKECYVDLGWCSKYSNEKEEHDYVGRAVIIDRPLFDGTEGSGTIYAVTHGSPIQTGSSNTYHVDMNDGKKVEISYHEFNFDTEKRCDYCHNFLNWLGGCYNETCPKSWQNKEKEE